MATFKLVTLFNMGTALSTPTAPIHRTAGWSETIYGNFASIQTLLAEATRQVGGGIFGGVVPGYWVARAQLLPLGASIVGARVQQVDVVGPVQTLALTYVGSQVREADIPQMALLIRAPALGANNIRRFTLRAIPDNQITEGEYQPSADYNVQMNLFLATLANWAFRAKQQATTKFKIISITTTGLMTTEMPAGFIVNQMVRITKARDAGGNLRSGRFQVSATGPGTTVFQLLNWPFTSSTGGTVFGDQTIFYPAIDANNIGISRTVTRRVGRPFVGYRGRRSRRR